jgi:hypothetical protein
MATPAVMEVLSLGTTFENEWKTLGREWVSTTPLLSNKSKSEVFLVPFWYVNVELEVGEPISFAMLECMTKSWMPSVTCESIDYLSKVLDGTPITGGSTISRGPDVVMRSQPQAGISGRVRS